MDHGNKRMRRLLYALAELETALRQAGRMMAAESVGDVARGSESVPLDAFLNNCREALEAVLLGERSLNEGLIGQILDATAIVDEGFFGLNDGANS